MAIGFAQHADSHGHFTIDFHASCVAQATRKKVSFATWVQFELAVGELLHTGSGAAFSEGSLGLYRFFQAVLSAMTALDCFALSAFQS